jgi:hypothetical protein
MPRIADVQVHLIRIYPPYPRHPVFLCLPELTVIAVRSEIQRQ